MPNKCERCRGSGEDPKLRADLWGLEVEMACGGNGVAGQTPKQRIKGLRQCDVGNAQAVVEAYDRGEID